MDQWSELTQAVRHAVYAAVEGGVTPQDVTETVEDALNDVAEDES